MGQWEPLADRIPVDMRRLATQLRRMKDRSGLTVPALAARTAQPAEAWAAYLAGRRLPPLDAVEVLAQASGADYDRAGALWRLAEKASAGAGDRVRGKPVPQPDPLDPLGPQEGLPGRGRRLLLLAVAGALAVGALLAVLFAAGPSDGRSPRDAAPTPTVRAGTTLAPPPGERHATRGAAPSAASRTPGRSASPASPVRSADSPAATTPSGTPPPVAPARGAPSSSPPAAPATPSGAPPTTPSAPASASATSTPTSLCLGLIVLGICLG